MSRQVSIPLVYEGLVVDDAFRADLIVEDLVIVELKTTEQILPVYAWQVLTYLKAIGKRLGLLINFNSVLIKQGITRIVNGLPD